MAAPYRQSDNLTGARLRWKINSTTIISRPSTTTLLGNELSLWRAIEGQRISHCMCGEGTILKITPSQNSQRPPTLWVLFDLHSDSPRWGWTNRREFSSLTALRDNQITSLTLPPDLVESSESTRAAPERRVRGRLESGSRRSKKPPGRRAAEEARQQELEAEARQAFQWLKEKYQIAWYSEDISYLPVVPNPYRA